MKNHTDDSARRFNCEEVIGQTAEYYHATVAELLSLTDRREVEREIAMYLCSRFTDASLSDIGAHFCRGSSGAGHACIIITDLIVEPGAARAAVEAITARLECLA
jgi:chromosomal replication initiation ATPase DnaA